MATTVPSAPAISREKDGRRNSLPPRRGQIKARIFESMVRSASKAGGLLGIFTTSDADVDSSTGDSGPSSTYDSDWHPSIL
ncbi:hypothetical protein SAY86_009048 [Trapa natans]|uniref:Uncharacterized protein n=1 Tax=Trapa natans TaxID=22666 RepID=A0AAN7QF89_TRANT|nr:hypothetical protein SAY86_009048 [Trapa natans]